MSAYSCMQLYDNKNAFEVDIMRQNIIYVVTSFMDAHGFMPCDSGRAISTIKFVKTPIGWTIYSDVDDVAEHIRDFDAIGKMFTRKMQIPAVCVVGQKDAHMLRLYKNGMRRDVYTTKPNPFGTFISKITSRGRSLRWSSLLKSGHNITELSDAFLLGRHCHDPAYATLCNLLRLDDSTKFGFASIEDSSISGVVTLYFCPSNRVESGIIQKIFGGDTVRRSVVGNNINGRFFKYVWGNV